MRILFFGTPDFARDLLSKLHSDYTIVGVLTQPDRQRGRGRKMQASPVKERAMHLGLPVFTPQELRDAEVMEELASLQPDVCVVAAYGKILPLAILRLAPLGALNIHTSLLPKYRGASPVESAILAGDDISGVTLMQMDEGLDTGPIYGQKKLSIEGKNTPQVLTEMVPLAYELLMEYFDLLEKGEKVIPTPQEGEASYCGKIEKSSHRLSWEESAELLSRKVRAFYPSAYTSFRGERLRILEARAADPSRLPSGTVSRINTEGIYVAAKTGDLLLKCLQRSGKRAMPAQEFQRGARLEIGTQFGGENVSI